MKHLTKCWTLGRSSFSAALVALALACLAAPPAIAAAAAAAAAAEAPAGPARHWQGGTADLEFARLNAALPGFGGMFYDEAGVATVYLTDPARPPAALGRLLGEVRILEGEWEFRQLDAWRGELRALFGAGGVVRLDVDETANRVRVGVDLSAGPGDTAAIAAVAARIDALGVPRSAVVIEAADPIYPMVALTDPFSPVPGGVEINFSNFLCTLGFNVRVETGGACYFITNDHCTDVQGVNTGTVYFQPFGGPRIGVEVRDPPFFTGGACPAGQECRYSDAAAARYDDPAMCEFGRLARTFLGSTTVDPANPRWTIVSKQDAPKVGQTMAKTGRTTGWTEGQVVATCVDTGVAGASITRLCQTFVNAGVAGGDSGSPVFRRRTSTSVAQLSGILWGGNFSGSQFVYSPIANIELDFGLSLPVF